MPRKSRKKPKAAFSPSESKTPRVAAQAGPPVEGQKPVWRFAIMDFDGPFGWRGFDPVLLPEINGKLANFETMTWQQIKVAGSHPVLIEEIAKAARDRLAEIGQEDLDELFSLRLSGKRRIWGILDRNQLKILWWDPEHRVCLSELKHT